MKNLIYSVIIAERGDGQGAMGALQRTTEVRSSVKNSLRGQKLNLLRGLEMRKVVQTKVQSLVGKFKHCPRGLTYKGLKKKFMTWETQG